MKDLAKPKIPLFISGVLAGISLTIIIILLFEFFNNGLGSKTEDSSIKLYVQDTNDGLSDSEGKIDLNSATQVELEQIPGIGEVKAAAIIEYRTKYGAFKEISELSYVPGIGENLINHFKKFFYIQ